MEGKFLELYHKWLEDLKSYKDWGNYVNHDLFKGKINYEEMTFEDYISFLQEKLPQFFYRQEIKDPYEEDFSILYFNFEGEDDDVFQRKDAFIRSGKECIKALKKYFPLEYSIGLTVAIDHEIENLKELNTKPYYNDNPIISDFISTYTEIKNKMENPGMVPAKPHEKIKWLGTPSQFSFLFLELVNKGFIEQPLYHSETSPTRYANLCFNNFEIQTTIGNLQAEFRSQSSLSEIYRAKFSVPEADTESIEFIIPEKKDVTGKRSGSKANKK